jgi:hypothetical protein
MPKTGHHTAAAAAHAQLCHHPTASNPHQRAATINQITENKIITSRLKNQGLR